MSYHNNSSSTPKSTTNAQDQECNTVYYHLFSMCHIGIEPYTFPQGSVPVWEGSNNFISEGCTTTSLSHNNDDFYISVGQPESGQAIGVTDNVGISCMVYVGYIPFPVVNIVKFTKSIIGTNKLSDCSTCIGLAIKGCTESKAINYNLRATIDDGSCEHSNLPCGGCCIDSKGNQYTPTQPCRCESGYVLSKSPCVVPDEPKPCKECCYNSRKGIYHPSNKGCYCDKGDELSSCMEKEVKDVLEETVCKNCCTNKSGKIFPAKYSGKYGCSCDSGSWSIACKGKEVKIKSTETSVPEVATSSPVVPVKPVGCIKKSCSSGELFDISLCRCVSTLVDTCGGKIDSMFNETLSHLPITNHLDNIYNLSGGYTNSWNNYKFKHYPTSEPTKTNDLCLAVDSWSDVQDAYWVSVKSVNVTYSPLGGHEKIISQQVSSFNELYSLTAGTLTKAGVVLDKTKGVWEAMELWNNDTTIWTPGTFSLTYSLVYCDCYDSGVFPRQQKPRKTIETNVEHVFGGTRGAYIDKRDNLVNYKCVTGTNPIVNEKQQTCQPTTDAVGVAGVFDNINDCINSGCGGYMSCNGGVSVDGVKFGEDKSYTPIVMCCESLIKSSEKPLTRDICQSHCVEDETWYPLYNTFYPNLMFDSLLGYMTRDLLNKVNNRECNASRDSREFKSMGYVEKIRK